jgi:cellulose synthase/poly-beta-1,6-N-acetylglucosamine synthase-like glycosyltransferase
MLHVLAVAVLSVLYVWTLYNIPILAVGVRRLRRSGHNVWRKVPAQHAEELPMVSIVVPVKDEEKVIGRLLDALLKLDYPSWRREIVIVEDGSADKTVEVCEKYAGLYPGEIRLVRRPISNGKPSALNFALKHVRGEIVGVFDADGVPSPDALLKMVKYFEDSSVAAVQGKLCSINADENMLTKFLSYEGEVQFEAYYRGKDALKLFVPLSGSCQFIRREVLEEVGGWDENSLSEDTELAVRLTEKGYCIKYAPDVWSLQESPASLTQLFRQRLRWFRGTMEVWLKYGCLVKKLDRRCIDAELTLAGPYIFIPCLMGYLITLYSLLISLQPNPVSTIIANVTSLFTVVILSLAGIALIYAAKPRKIRNVLWLPFIYSYWVFQNFVALVALMQILLRRPRRWVKTAKNGTVTNKDLEMIVFQGKSG